MREMNGEQDEDVVAAVTHARSEAIQLAFRRFKKYGLLLLVVVAGVLLVSKGMPLHNAAPIVGPLLALAGVYLLARTAIYGGIALQTWLIGKYGDHSNRDRRAP
jgi:hypothetical protein